VSGRSIIGPLRQIAKIQRHGQVDMKAIVTRCSHSFGLGRTSVFVLRNGNDIFASRAEERKENVGCYHSSWKGYRRNGRTFASASRTSLTEINCF
jgi:hypothetical protein